MKTTKGRKLACILILLFLPGIAAATETGTRMRHADELCNIGDAASYLEAAKIYREVADAHPDNYEAQWKTAMANVCYGEQKKFAMDENYNEIARRQGRLGMGYAARAKKLAPERIEGIFWYALSAGAYAEGASVLTAIREGLKGKFQKNFEKAYAMDKSYWNYYSVMALGRFWYALPWPMTDNKKAIKYLSELNQLNPGLDEGRLYLAEALLKQGTDKAAAKDLLVETANSDIPLFHSRSQELLQKHFDFTTGGK